MGEQAEREGLGASTLWGPEETPHPLSLPNVRGCALCPVRLFLKDTQLGGGCARDAEPEGFFLAQEALAWRGRKADSDPGLPPGANREHVVGSQ